MNCNLSPISTNSLQFVCENFNLPEEIIRHQNLNKYQVNQSMDTNSMESSTEDIDLVQNILQCPICIFTTSIRSKFTEHLISHCTSKCNNPNFKAILAQLPILDFFQDKSNYSFPTLEEYVTHVTEKIDKSKLLQVNPSNITQKQNKNSREGKSCKQCNFMANTKMEYWEHMRCHIKGFTCSKCSFVTKYKHHMNHHWLSVHDGSKPFKCKKCPYTCVSKSMLTSHLKKHSNIYPYRCANCAYKTKFCNALKKHLRKKVHQPAMVLNADGTPNPLSIIDVYGTKRGPKQKSSVDKEDELDESIDQNTIINSQHSSAPTSPILPLQSPVTRFLSVTTMNEMNYANRIIQNSMKQNQSAVTFPYNDLVAALNLPNHPLHREDAMLHKNMQEINHVHPNTLTEYVKVMKMSEQYVQNLPITCSDTNDANRFHISDDVKTISNESSTFVTLKTQLKSQKDESTDAPLDLRIGEVKNQFQFQLLATNSPKIIGTNKRKGKAMKLERRAIEENTNSEQKETESLQSSIINESDIRGENQNIKDIKGKTIADSIEHICHYCEITFGNVVMYTMHMGCHDFDDPYTCNMCGHHCTDKLSFFIHIAQSQHA